MSARVGHGASIDAEVVSVTSVDDFDAIATEWDALAAASGSIFSTALWSRLWWNHHNKGRELLLHAARARDGSLAAILPLYAWRRRLPRVLRFLGHGPGDELGPVHPRDAHVAAASALGSALDALDWDVFLGEQLPGDEDWPALVAGSTWRREASPSLTLPRAWEEYLDERSSNFREQLRRREAGLAREGAVVVRLAGADTLDRDLDALFELHRARWGAARTDRRLALPPGGRPTGTSPRLAAALVARARRPANRRVARVSGGIGMQLLPGRPRSRAGPPLGRLHPHGPLDRSAIAEGASEYRFGRGDEAFKFRFTGDNPGLETIVLTRGVVGATASAVARLARVVRNIAR